MPFETYVAKKFQPATLDVIYQAREILTEYEAMGFDLTLRQLFYQFVSRDLLPNKQRSYDRIGSIVNDARLAGLIDWDHIVDRTRNVVEWQSYDSPAAAARATADRYRRARWADQPYHVEVWIEKDALVGVIEGICSRLMVPYFSCRGYTSQSEMWGASQRLGEALRQGKDVKILHLGDHDPSGIDMSRDIHSRLRLFMATDYFRENSDLEHEEVWTWIDGRFEVDRIALTMDQIDEFEPPPNPAKMTDSRATDYVRRYGYESWELDALSPDTLADLISDGVREVRDEEAWEIAVQREKDERSLLTSAADEWDELE